MSKNHYYKSFLNRWIYEDRYTKELSKKNPVNYLRIISRQFLKGGDNKSAKGTEEEFMATVDCSGIFYADWCNLWSFDSVLHRF